MIPNFPNPNQPLEHTSGTRLPLPGRPPLQSGPPLVTPEGNPTPPLVATKRKKGRTPNPVVGARVSPDTRRELERVARRMAGGRISVLVTAILSSWGRGNFFCVPCGHEHPVSHPESER